MLNNPFNNWYTDNMDIYRQTDVQVGSLTKPGPLALVASKVPCRIYRTNNPQMVATPTSSEYKTNDMIACAVTVDVQPGDKLIVYRGGRNKPSLAQEEIYYAGNATDYFEPYGGVTPRLQHKQLPVGAEHRTSKKPV